MGEKKIAIISTVSIISIILVAVVIALIMLNLSTSGDDMLGNKEEKKVELNQLSESELLSIMKEDSEHEIENHEYVDFNHDGYKELVGTYLDEDYIANAWYCSCDGKKSLSVYQSKEAMQYCSVELLQNENATHVAINTSGAIDNSEYYTILGLQGDSIYELVSNEKGNIRVDEKGNISLYVFGTDALSD